MTQFLVTEENPGGYKLEDILLAIRKDMVVRANKIVDDDKPQARQVLENNIKILGLITECINIATESTKLLDRSFGPHRDGHPRIGVL